MNRVSTLFRLTYWRPVVIVLATTVYCIFFITAYAAISGITAAMVAFPVMLVGGFYGLRASLLTGLLAFPLNILLFNAVGVDGWNTVVSVDGMLAHLVVLVIGAVFGWTHDSQVAKEYALKQAQNLNSELNAVLSIIPDILFQLDENGTIMDYRVGQDAALQLDTTVIGKLYSTILPPELVEIIQQKNHTERTISTVQMTIDSTYRWYEMQITPLPDKHLIILLRDLTQQKRSEQQRLELVAQQSRISYLQEFISNLSHDLKTPLTVIKTSLYLLERFDDPTRQAEKLEKIKLQTRHLEKLIEDIIMITRLDSTLEESLMFVQLNRVINTMADSYRPKAEAKGLVLSINLPQISPMVLANESSIQRVLSNILDNALTYTEEGEIQVAVLVKADRVRIAIKDTGIGMRDDEKDRIFERFFRADKARSVHTGGAGLGLSIAKRIIEIHQGSIQVESDPRAGTIFTIELPLFKVRASEFITNVSDVATQPDRRVESK